jgi:hypothetical protein
VPAVCEQTVPDEVRVGRLDIYVVASKTDKLKLA